MAPEIERRITDLEEQAREDGEAPSDLIITALTEQHERGPDGTLIPVKREPIGYFRNNVENFTDRRSHRKSIRAVWRPNEQLGRGRDGQLTWGWRLTIRRNEL